MNYVNRAVRAAFVCGALASTAACATMTRGTTTAFNVVSEPPAAGVKTSNGFACEATPCTFKMKRKSEFDVTVSKAGYKTWTGKVTNHVSSGGGAGMAGNVLVGGLIGAGVDVASGAMLDLAPNPLKVTLEAEAKTADAAAPAEARTEGQRAAAAPAGQ
ncbi:MAG: hypothetical protein JWP50_3222 [Phenylobacterium sp.]|nr:hypothetical protein [Phenylobacterium sp.]